MPLGIFAEKHRITDKLCFFFTISIEQTRLTQNEWRQVYYGYKGYHIATVVTRVTVFIRRVTMVNMVTKVTRVTMVIMLRSAALRKREIDRGVFFLVCVF